MNITLTGRCRELSIIGNRVIDGDARQKSISVIPINNCIRSSGNPLNQAEWDRGNPRIFKCGEKCGEVSTRSKQKTLTAAPPLLVAGHSWQWSGMLVPH